MKEGFCWPAFFFGFAWAFAVRCWVVGALLLSVTIALAVAMTFLGLAELQRTLVWLGFMALIGWSANDWRRATLVRGGWQFDSVVAAPDRDSAMLRWLDRQAVARVSTPPPAIV